MSQIYCQYCGFLYDTDIQSYCPNEHVEDYDFPFVLDEDLNIRTSWGEIVLEVCPHNDWIMNFIIKSINKQKGVRL